MTTIITINKEPVELYKILKFEGIADSGAAAKAMVATGHVRLNGIIETQKRKKILSGDTLIISDDTFSILLEQHESE